VAPVFIGDTVHLRVTVESTKPMERLGGGFVGFKMEVINQSDEVVNRGVWQVLCKAVPVE
jgi:3-hydroxybutyryl-CoA dehydratase